MSDKNPGYLEDLRLDRSQAVQLVLVGLILAFGVNLIAGKLDAHLREWPALLIGLLLVLAALAMALHGVYRPRSRTRNFDGFFVYDRRENVLVGQWSTYSLGDALARYVEAGLAEDPQTKAIWDRNPISLLPLQTTETTGNPRRSLDLVRQACEYFVLRSFSEHLSDHFTAGEYAKNELATDSHLDLPEVLLENRFLRTFAEPMEDRPAFSAADSHNDSVIVSQIGGALYERFELVHPKGWRVRRSAAKAIEIETARFVLKVEPRCEGFGVNLPRYYLARYLGLTQEIIEKRQRYSTLGISVTIEISPRRTWLMTRRGWRNYRWIDQWIADLEPQISTAAHLEEIGYASAEATFLMLARRQHEREVSGSEPAVPKSPDDLPGGPPPGARKPFVVGDKIEHVSFGSGEVKAFEPGGVVIVKFDDDGTSRKLMTDYAPMRHIPPASNRS